MPFVQRIIQPRCLSQRSLFDENGRGIVSDFELEAVTNNTLSNVLRQLASLVLVANDIFEDLAWQLQDVHRRSTKLKASIHLLEERVSGCDPKTVTVPESDICTFSLRTEHYKSRRPFETNLFTISTRPSALQKIYEVAAPTPVRTIRKLDRFRRDGNRSSKFFVCTPVLEGRKKRCRKVDLEIETRKPVVVEELRRWTSAEAMGEMTVLPSNTSKIASGLDVEGSDHLLPSPEEQMMALALRFPPSIVAVDVSGKPFERMTGMRRSLINVELNSDGSGGRRKVRSRRHREKRRNTIAGTSQKEIQQAIAGETTTETEGCEFEPLSPLRSKSTDLFKPPKTGMSPADNIRNHFNTLKNWSKTKLKMMNRNSSSDSCKPSFQGSDVIDDMDIYETITTVKRRREKERKPSTSSSAISIPVSTSSIATSLAVKLRENSLQRRHRRKGNSKEEPVNSSSGNWSASSESGRTSIASETTAPPKSSTTTSSNSLNHHHPPPSVQSRRRYLNASTSSSVSEGTITPDINDMQYHDFDGETSSVYSCDTEGYYTSFHMDSGLKTLKEEEIALSFSTLQLQDSAGPTTTSFNNSSGSGSGSFKMSQLTAENEYELFGKGSTSTTTSSAGTVCTTLLANGHGYGSTRSLSQFAPAVPERKSSLERKEKKGHKEKGSDSEEIELISDNQKYSGTTLVGLIHDSPSPDSGHNTSSSPAGSTSQNSQSPNEHLEFSESDLEGCERVERIRSKTAISSSRIPSMCVITPPQSDDEVSLRNYNQVPYGLKLVPLNEYETVKTESSGSRSLHIQIPDITESKSESTDIYALPDKSKKTKVTNIKTVSTKGVLETNLDSVPEDAKNALHIVVNRESGYATIKREERKTTFRSPSPSGGTVIIKEPKEEERQSEPLLKPSLLPGNFIGRFKEAVSKQKKSERKMEEGEYVTIVEKSPSTDAKHSVAMQKSEYVTLDELPAKKETENVLSPSSRENSLERKKRIGARVTLDSEGKVVYSSDSLKRRKQHSTFIPGKFVRESPTPSPIPDHRVPKQIRPVNCSGLVRTNSDDRQGTQVGKIIIKAGSRSCDSPTKDFVRIPPTRVVSPTSTPNPKRHERGARITFENGVIKNRSASPASSSEASSLERKRRITAGRCGSPSSSSSSSNDARKPESYANPEEGLRANTQRWISNHPAALRHQQYSPSGFPRSHPMYWTLPSRGTYSDHGQRQNSHCGWSKWNPPQEGSRGSPHNPISSQRCDAKSSPGRIAANSRQFLSSTPTKGEVPAAVSPMNGMSPILKESFLGSKTKMTSEEIFTAIHKSKKKLSMKEGESRSEPFGEWCSTEKSRDRSSWSPNSGEPLDLNRNEPRCRKSWTGGGTSINTFKKLLLQHGNKSSGPKDGRMSAVEQLKLSKANPGPPPQRSETAKAPRSILNARGRGQWRFSSPRTDILSSTIPEDCSEVEKQEEVPTMGGGLTFAWNRKDDSGAATAEGAPRESKDDENLRSLEMTKKSLQEARKNFFSDVKPAGRSSVDFRASLLYPRKKTSIISLETAL